MLLATANCKIQLSPTPFFPIHNPASPMALLKPLTPRGFFFFFFYTFSTLKSFFDF